MKTYKIIIKVMGYVLVLVSAWLNKKFWCYRQSHIVCPHSFGIIVLFWDNNTSTRRDISLYKIWLFWPFICPLILFHHITLFFGPFVLTSGVQVPPAARHFSNMDVFTPRPYYSLVFCGPRKSLAGPKTEILRTSIHGWRISVEN